MLVSMQKWEYKVFSSHLDPAELVVVLDSSGREGWELVTLVAVANKPPFEVIKPVTITVKGGLTGNHRGGGKGDH